MENEYKKGMTEFSIPVHNIKEFDNQRLILPQFATRPRIIEQGADSFQAQHNSFYGLH